MDNSTHLKIDNSMLTDLHDELGRAKFELAEANENCKTLAVEKSALVMEINEVRPVIEVLRQENFILKNELKMLRHQQESMDYSLLVDENSKIRDVCEAQIKAMQEQHKQEIMNLRSDIEALGKEVNDRKLSENELREENEVLRSRVEVYRNDADMEKSMVLKDTSSVSSNFDDAVNLRCIELEQKLNDQMEIFKEVQEKNEKLTRYNDELREEKEDLVRSNLNYCGKLEKKKGIIEELNAELEILRVHDTDRQGNSLFAEVEDRRVETQRKLKMAQEQLKALQVQRDRIQSHNMALKTQVCSLLQPGNGGDESYMELVTMEVQQLTLEKKNLMYEKQKLEEKLARQASNVQSIPSKAYKKDPNEFDYSEYLQKLLTERDLEIKKLKDDLWRESLRLADEINWKVKAESCVRKLENEKYELRNSLIKKNLDINMLKLNTNTNMGRNAGTEESMCLPQVRVEKLKDDSDSDEENRVPIVTDAPNNDTTNSSSSVGKPPVQQKRITLESMDQCSQQ